MFLEEYQKQLKNLLEEPDSIKRKVVYYGIALGFVDYVLNKKSETDSIGQLNLILKLEADEFISKIVELTIVNSVDMEKAILDLINYKIYTIRPDIGYIQSGTCIYDFFAISKFISLDVLESIEKEAKIFNQARSTTNNYLAQLKYGETNKEPVTLKTPEESGIKLSVVGPKS